jgi:hypothetical protein
MLYLENYHYADNAIRLVSIASYRLFNRQNKSLRAPPPHCREQCPGPGSNPGSQ